MIIFHNHKFIFLNTAKSVGSSIGIALSDNCGIEDIITPIFAENEKTRATLGYAGLQPGAALISTYRPINLGRSTFPGRRKCLNFLRIPGSVVRRPIGVDIWIRYYEFVMNEIRGIESFRFSQMK